MSEMTKSCGEVKLKSEAGAQFSYNLWPLDRIP